MAWIEEFQVALVGSAVTAAFAALAYAGNSVMERRQQKRKERAGLIAQLQGLAALLDASGALFRLQQEQVQALLRLLEKNHAKEVRGSEGYDEAMARCYLVMTDQERERHGVIRAYTEHSMRRINQVLSEWCSADRAFKSELVATRRRRELAQELFALEIHLTLWHAKFESWIPGHPERALVYLDDEKKHGLGFPNAREADVAGRVILRPGVEAEVQAALAELRKKWSER